MEQSTRTDWRLEGMAGSQPAVGASHLGIGNRNQEVSRAYFIDRLNDFNDEAALVPCVPAS
jgi:hypothetical protein